MSVNDESMEILREADCLEISNSLDDSLDGRMLSPRVRLDIINNSGLDPMQTEKDESNCVKFIPDTPTSSLPNQYRRILSTPHPAGLPLSGYSPSSCEPVSPVPLGALYTDTPELNLQHSLSSLLDISMDREQNIYRINLNLKIEQKTTLIPDLQGYTWI